LAKDRHFSPDNVWKYLALQVNQFLEYTVVAINATFYCKSSKKYMQISHDFITNKVALKMTKARAGLML